jgi:hypothetical protein
MKRDFSPVYLALGLMVFCIAFRVISSHYTEYTFDLSPLLAVAYIGTMYLPRRWGWLVVPITLVFTELAFLRVNYLTDGSGQVLSWWTLASVVFYAVLYAAISGWGAFIARFRSLGLVIGGSLVASLVFYVASNTFSWVYDGAVHLPNGYAPTLAGWFQANTTGLPGYAPTWTFLRNGMLGDLFFGFLLLLVLDRALLFGHGSTKTATRAA